MVKRNASAPMLGMPSGKSFLVASSTFGIFGHGPYIPRRITECYRFTVILTFSRIVQVTYVLLTFFHPFNLHGGLLARRDLDSHLEAAKENQIELIDLVVVNLYPFKETILKPDVTYADAVENIDIGGPSMLRSAATHHASVTVVVDPPDYAVVLDELSANGETTYETNSAKCC